LFNAGGLFRRHKDLRVGPRSRSADDGRRGDDTAAKEYSPPPPILPAGCLRSKSGPR